MKAGENELTHAIDWHDSPKVLCSRGGRLPNGRGISRSDSEQKFNEDFDKWYMRSDSDEQLPSVTSSGTDSTDLTPPLLRIRPIAFHNREGPGASSTSADVAIVNKRDTEDSDLARKLAQSRNTMREIAEKRRHASLAAREKNCQDSVKVEPSSVSGGVWTPGGTSDTEENYDTSSVSFGPLTSTVLTTPKGRGLKRFGEAAAEEPSPITPVNSRKRRRQSDGFEVGETDGPKTSTQLNCYSVGELSDSTVRADSCFCVPGKINHGYESKLDANGSVNGEEMNNFVSPVSTNAIVSPKENLHPGTSNVVTGRALNMCDSMDDEQMNEFLSQVPDVPYGDKLRTAGSTDVASAEKSNAASVVSMGKSIQFGLKSQRSAPQRKSVLGRSSADRTPLRRCRTLNEERQRVGGFQQRLGFAGDTSSSGVRGAEVEIRPRSSSLDRNDSFWDDAEFEGYDFAALDSAK